MPKTYEVADKPVLEFIEATMRKYHSGLVEARVTVAALMVGGGLKHHGYAACAVVKINSLKDRVEGKEDVTIEIDGDQDGWERWPVTRCEAVIDHELNHLIVVKDEGGRVKRDDAGRPKLRLRLHDVQIGGFEDVIERHKEHAVEAQAIANAQNLVQGFFKF